MLPTRSSAKVDSQEGRPPLGAMSGSTAVLD